MSDEEKALEEEIMADARRRAERIRRRAEREADDLRQRAREQAEQQRERIQRQARQRAEEQQQRLRARIQQDLAALRRNARHRILEDLRERAREKLAQLPRQDGYREVLTRLALGALERMDGDTFELVLRDEDRKGIGSELLDRIGAAARDELDRDVKVRLSDEPLSAAGGLALRGADGRQVADQTFEARLDRLWGQMRGELMEMLPDLREISQ
jgi:vacuolar-type H+-ATPase subunit E/Vma4